MAIKKYIFLIPLVILILTVGNSCYIVFTTDIVFATKHYLGFIFLFLCVICSFIRRDIAVYLTGITLFIGTLNFIAFTPVIEAYAFGFTINHTGLDIKIQPVSFFFLIVYLILNTKLLLSQFRRKRAAC